MAGLGLGVRTSDRTAVIALLLGGLTVASGGASADAAQAPVAIERGPVGLPDVEGGYASTHLFVRVREGIQPRTLPDGSLSFGPHQKNQRKNQRDAKQGIPAATLAAGAALRKVKATRAVPFFAAVANQALARQLGMDRIYRIDVPMGTDTPTLAATLAPFATLFDRVELDGVGGLAEVPNDPQFPNQYALHNTGQAIGGITGLADADVDAPEAWDLAAARGLDTSTVTVAVLDSGVNEHVQLAGRLLTGFNVPDGTTVTVDECQSHGTHVSGVIAASGNDGVGSAGMAWQAKITPYVVVNPCTGFESSVATALTMATDAGHRLVNMSLQFYTGSATLHDAVLYAYAQDVIMVAAAGNNNNSAIAFPGRWGETICVAASTNTDTKASFSNFGPEVDVCAGGNLVRSLTGTTGYGDKSGTSQATPAVTGTIALMLAWNPTLTPEEVRDILIATATDIGDAGFDNTFGYGRINAYAALFATPSGEPNDLNNDGAVNAGDLAIILGAWGPCLDCEVGCSADLNADCSVDQTDLAILLGSWS